MIIDIMRFDSRATPDAPGLGHACLATSGRRIDAENLQVNRTAASNRIKREASLT